MILRSLEEQSAEPGYDPDEEKMKLKNFKGKKKD